LSGGQRQRLAIARAVARNPRILILDEATRYVDTSTEAEIARRLQDLRCTRIVIANRLSAIRKADRIVVLQAGEIVEAGRHEALMRRRGVYADLCESQERAVV